MNKEHLVNIPLFFIMKRHGNLFEKIVKYENIQLAHERAKRGKSHYSEVRMVESDPDKYLKRVQLSLIEKTFSTSNYKVFKVSVPKEREISKLPYYPDRIVQHAIMNVLRPIWDPIFIYDVYSAIPGKGIHRAIFRLKDFLKDKENTRFCLQFDISKFYPSVSHDILLELIKRKIKCCDTLWLLGDIVYSPPGVKGIPIGNFTSQYFANIYLNWFDHYLKEKLRMPYYIRYADDGILLASNKQRLQNVQEAIELYLADNLNLSLNPKTQIYPVGKRGINFLGYRTFRNYVLLRKESAKRFKQKIKTIKKHWNRMPPRHIISSIMSHVGWLKHCNGYNLIRVHILEDAQVMEIIDKSANRLGIENPLEKQYSVVSNAI
ncbi:MAG: reverse transcriptase [Deltaproteobacteria bacterium]|nr:reverse transcriptase [Deltaproteobacteria bacterium]